MFAKRKEMGFTLTELLVAIVILGIITLMAIPQISNLINSNNDAKYEAYEKTMKTSGKLYTDSYKEDMFGNNASGCYDIPYDKMEDKKLIQDIKINNVTCKGGTEKKTFVRVYKSGNYYRYKTSILCTSKTDESAVEYSNVIEGNVESDTTFCDGKTLDLDGPIISLKENGATWTTGKDMTVQLTIADNFGLFENIQIRYAWTTTPGAVDPSLWVNVNFNNKRNEEKVTKTIEVPQNKNDDYYLVVEPIMVRDANGNYQTQVFKSNVFKFDNTKPTCSLSVEGDQGLSEWYIEKPTISLTMDDTRGEITTYTTRKTKVEKKDYANIKFNEKATRTQGDTKKVTWYAYIKDAAGNVVECKTDEFKVDTTPPTAPNKGKFSVSGSTKNVTISEAKGAEDETSGILEYRYLILNSSGEPENDNTNFTTSRSLKRNCGTSYYVYAIAVDKAGNKSDVYFMGNDADGKDEYSEYGTCSKKCGGGTQTRTNTCELVTTGLERNCNEAACCRSGSIYYVDGTSCSKPCNNGGTYNRIAYAAEDHTKRCEEFDTNSGGSACNTGIDCCSKKTTTYGSWGSCEGSCGDGTKYRDVIYKSEYDSSITCSTTTRGDSTTCATGIDCCSKKTTTYGSWGSCEGSCGTGTKYRDIIYKSEYNSSVTCSTTTRGDSASCNTGIDCCSKKTTTYGSWGSCEGSCGTGTKYRDVIYKSAYNSSITCSTTTRGDSASCDTGKACCSYVYYTDAGTYCGSAGSYFGVPWNTLKVCDRNKANCKAATSPKGTCEKMGGTYFYFTNC